MSLKAELSSILSDLDHALTGVYTYPSPKEGEVESRRLSLLGSAKAKLEFVLDGWPAPEEPEESQSDVELVSDSKEECKPQPPQQPSLGRIVHYVLPCGPRKGEIRPAIIVRVWQPIDDASLTLGMSNLSVFQDQQDDFQDLEHKSRMKGSVLYCPNKTPGTWHWPERV